MRHYANLDEVKQEHRSIDSRLHKRKKDTPHIQRLVTWKTPLTPETLRLLIHYDPETGIFRWARNRKGGMKAGDVAGCVDDLGYIRMTVNGKRVRGQQLAWFYVHGEWPTMDIDHINGNRQDNRIVNLRHVSRKLNLQNMKKARGVVGLMGVTPKGERFAAQITANGQHFYLGRFDTAEEAHEAYIKAKREKHEGCTV